MIVEKILKQLTPERIKKEIEGVQKVKLPPELQKWVKEYEKVGDRNEFIWKWAYKSIQIVTFSGISKKYQTSLKNSKLLIIMFIVLLDDIADKVKDESLLNELLKVPFQEKEINLRHLSKNKKRYLNFTQEVWHKIQKMIIDFPYHQEMKRIFEFDWKVLLVNAINYGYLINKNHYLINKIEYQERFSYNIQGFLNLDLDLMCCYNKFSRQKMGSLREIAWRSQRLAQMVNWISTWEREIKENDFTSGIFALAVDKEILATKQLKRKNSEKIIQKIKKSNLEKEMLNECNKEYHNIKLVGDKFKQANIKKFILGLKKFITLQLCSRGYY